MCSAADMLSIDVMPLDDADALPVPREAARGAAHWQPFVWFASDAFALACEARRLCSAKLKQARIPRYGCFSRKSGLIRVCSPVKTCSAAASLSPASV